MDVSFSQAQWRDRRFGITCQGASHVLQHTTTYYVRAGVQTRVYTTVRYEPAAGTAAGTAATAADMVGGALPPAPGASLRVDLFGTYNACESVFLALLPTAVDGATLPAARYPGTTASP